MWSTLELRFTPLLHWLVPFRLPATETGQPPKIAGSRRAFDTFLAGCPSAPRCLNAAQPALVTQGACIVRYLLPFDVIKQPVELSTDKHHVTATMAYEGLLGLIRHLLSQVVVDEQWYLAQYPDVAEVIAQGTNTSATQHIIDNGDVENRLLFLIPVNGTWYFTNDPDAAASVRKGTEPSAQAHFMSCDQATGRVGCPIQCLKVVVSREREAPWRCRAVRRPPSQRSVQGDKISRPTWACGKHAIL
jgi:hypothetical protein